MSFTVTVSTSSPSSFSSQWFNSDPKLTIRFISLKSTPLPRLLFPLAPQASKRVFNTNNNNNNNTNIVDDHGIWSRSIDNEFLNNLNEEDEEEEEEEDRSLDLLVRFIQNLFKKVSKQARKAVRSVLPVSISTKLVTFSVNGVLVLAFLWVLKAFLEVVCTLGSVVFVSILLIRGIWSGITYLQESRYLKMNELDDDHHAWTGAQPAA
ncbi:hypothetical protein JCGZ_16384 [Jatropha curcas]|uniref:Uncharacterized protein n=1 Tax=Jatropha curcas TaxID=180498 RepID=A0A067L7W3_JATCU|nr:uncharacterized protein LOC105650825 [Jatropha curcas]KDP44551.1 hypothetical protein JCGZ_16384 [Jatropha curcas]